MSPDLKPSQSTESIPTSTFHREYTVTDMCYLIEAGSPCSGCTLEGVQEPDPGVIIDPTLPAYNPNRYELDTDFITEVLGRQVQKGVNLITIMGGDPLTIRGADKLIRWIVDHPTLNGRIYSSSAYYFKPDGSLNRRFHEHEEAGLFTGEFGYFKASVDMVIEDKTEIPKSGALRGDAFKAYHGLMLAEKLALQGYKVDIHQTLKTNTVDHAIPLYEWAKERGIRFSFCPLVYNPYVSNGRPISNYSSRLTDEHKGQLEGITDYLIEDTVERFKQRKERVFVPSSAFTRLIPEYGATNRLNCREHRKGIRPNTLDIHPTAQGWDGEMERWCIAQNTDEGGMNCSGCHYIGIDPGQSDYWNLEQLVGLEEGDIRFLNADVNTKNSNYDPTGQDLFFNHKGELLSDTNEVYL